VGLRLVVLARSGVEHYRSVGVYQEGQGGASSLLRRSRYFAVR